MENSQFVTDAEIDRYLNESISELYDLIIEQAGQEYFLETYGFSTVANQDTYLLPADLYQLKGVDVEIGAPAPLPILPYMFNERFENRALPGFWNRYGDIRYRLLGHAHSVPTAAASPISPPQPTGLQLDEVAIVLATTFTTVSGEVEQFYIGQTLVFRPADFETTVVEVRADTTPAVVVCAGNLVVGGVLAGDTIHQVRVADYAPQIRFTPIPVAANAINVWYIPHAPVLAAATDVWNGFNGWEEYPIVDSAIKCLEKEESDTSALELRKQRLINRIQSMSQKRDGGFPERVTDVTRVYDNWWRW